MIFDSKDIFCSYCGFSFEKHQVKYPKTCYNCQNITYNNPIPVVTTLVLTFGKPDQSEISQPTALIVKRNIEPKKDCWALPGGFLEFGETWQEGSAREVFEETGFKIDPSSLNLMKILNSSNGNLLIFSFCWVDSLDISKFSPNTEVSELKLIYKPEELAFPTHTEVIHSILGLNSHD